MPGLFKVMLLVLGLETLAANASGYTGWRKLFVKKLKAIKHWLLVGTHQTSLFNQSILQELSICVNIASHL